MPKSGLSGQYGLIPNSVIRKKYEVTKGYENPYHTDDYQRSLLKDFRPDAPFLESDQIRRDNHSEERILLRTEGHRSGEVPDHSEMFLELTEKDPRGIAVDPDFGKFREQSYSRKEYYKMYPDNDDSVTDWQGTPVTAMRNRTNTFYDLKRRLKIFTTSKGSMMASRNFKGAADSNIDLTAGQLPLISIPEAVFEDIEDRTAIRSNQTNIGWHRTTDHEFAVAQYGQAPVGLKPTRAEINRSQQTPDSFVEDHFQDQRVNAGLAVLMQDIMKEREVQRSSDQTQKLQISKELDTYSKMYQHPNTSAVAKSEIKQEMSRLQGLMNQLADLGTDNSKQNIIHNMVSENQNSRNESKVDTEQMANSMSGATVNPGNREHKKREIMELMTAKEAPEFDESHGKTRSKFVTDNGIRKSTHTASMTDGMQTVKLSSLIPISNGDRRNDMHKYIMGAGEGFATESYDSHFRKINNSTAGRTSNDASDETAGWSALEGSTKDRFTRGVGSKYTQDQHNTDHQDLNIMGDM